MNYDRAMFGMKLPDCRSLAKTLEKSETLVTLALPGNLLEDDKIRMIASGLVDNRSVTNLDLSHNKVWHNSHPSPQAMQPVTYALHLCSAYRLLHCSSITLQLRLAFLHASDSGVVGLREISSALLSRHDCQACTI